jgi:hypothetical protein
MIALYFTQCIMRSRATARELANYLREYGRARPELHVSSFQHAMDSYLDALCGRPANQPRCRMHYFIPTTLSRTTRLRSRRAAFMAYVVASAYLPRLLRALPAQPSREAARRGGVAAYGFRTLVRRDVAGVRLFHPQRTRLDRERPFVVQE